MFSDALSKINCENTSTLRQGNKELDQLTVLSIAFAHPFNKPPDKKRLLLNAKTLLADACMFVSNNAPSEDSPADPELRPHGTCSAPGCCAMLTGEKVYCSTCGTRSNHTDRKAKQTHYLTVFCGCAGAQGAKVRTWKCDCIELQKVRCVDTTDSALLEHTLRTAHASLRHACDVPGAFCKTPLPVDAGSSHAVDRLCQEDEFAREIRTLKDEIAHNGILYRALSKLLPTQRQFLRESLALGSAEK